MNFHPIETNSKFFFFFLERRRRGKAAFIIEEQEETISDTNEDNVRISKRLKL